MKTKKILLIAILSVICVFSLFGCVLPEGKCEHEYLTYTVQEATCEKEGLQELICQKCGEKATIKKNKKGHDLVWKVVTMPQENKKGLLLGSCENCDYEEYKTHEISDCEYNWTVTTPATCEGAGEKSGVCVICEKVVYAPVQAKGHSYENSVCTVCGALEPVTVLPQGQNIGLNLEYLRNRFYLLKNKTDKEILNVLCDNKMTYLSAKNGIVAIDVGDFSFNLEGCVSSFSATGGKVETISTIGVVDWYGKQELQIKYVDGTVENVGEFDTENQNDVNGIKSVFINEQNEFFVVHENNAVYKYGKLLQETVSLDQSVLVYLKNETGYSVVGINSQTAKKIVIPATHRGKPVLYIEENAFRGNGYIEEVYIGENVKEICKGAFMGCDNLSKVVGMSKVSLVEWDAFFNCKKLLSVEYHGTKESADKIIIASYNDSLKNATWTYTE